MKEKTQSNIIWTFHEYKSFDMWTLLFSFLFYHFIADGDLHEEMCLRLTANEHT